MGIGHSTDSSGGPSAAQTAISALQNEFKTVNTAIGALKSSVGGLTQQVSALKKSQSKNIASQVSAAKRTWIC